MKISSQNTIPIFFTFNDNYAFPAEVAIYSLLKYADKQYFYKLYVLHDSLSLKNQSKLSKIVKSFESNATLEFISVEEFHKNLDWEQIKSKQHYSKEIYNKLIVDIIFPQYEKIICTDVDVVFKDDISKSFFLCDDASYVSGIVNLYHNDLIINYSDHFTEKERAIISKGIGAGYLVFNLNLIRENGIGQKMREYYKNNLNRLILPEQDVINLCCYPHIKVLPPHYMVCIWFYSVNTQKIKFRKDIPNAETLFDSCLRNPIQIHYAGYNKPWNSFFIKKWSSWMQEVIDAGLITEYFIKLPGYLLQRRKKYNLLRFCRKMKKKLTAAICKK